MATLADLIEQMNAAKPSIPRHHNRGRVYRYDPPACRCVVDCDCRELDAVDAPDRIHAQLPED